MKPHERNKRWSRIVAVVLALGVTAVTPIALAHQSSNEMVGQNRADSQQSTTGDSGATYGPGMMGGRGYGPEMMRGYGYGPGMMGGRGYGPEMMRGYGYDPGMMGGCGYASEMRGRYGYGSGMRSGYAGKLFAWIKLNEEQQKNIDQIRENFFQKQQKLRVDIYDGMMKIHQEVNSSNPDLKDLGKNYEHVARARKQMFLNRIEMEKQLNRVLTKKQREKLRSRWNSQGNPDQDGN